MLEYFSTYFNWIKKKSFYWLLNTPKKYLQLNTFTENKFTVYGDSKRVGCCYKKCFIFLPATTALRIQLPHRVDISVTFQTFLFNITCNWKSFSCVAMAMPIHLLVHFAIYTYYSTRMKAFTVRLYSYKQIAASKCQPWAAQKRSDELCR